MVNSWGNYTLKKQLIIVFGILATVSLILIGISCIIFIVVIGNNTQNSLYTSFQKNAQGSISDIMTSGAQLFDMKLAQLTYNFPNVMAFNAEDSFRSDYPFGYIPSH